MKGIAQIAIVVVGWVFAYALGRIHQVASMELKPNECSDVGLKNGLGIDRVGLASTWVGKGGFISSRLCDCSTCNNGATILDSR